MGYNNICFYNGNRNTLSVNIFTNSRFTRQPGDRRTDTQTDEWPDSGVLVTIPKYRFPFG